MKILFYTDVHWSCTSSIVRSRGEKYSTRLNNLIKSVSWAEGLADTENCDLIICLGDFFDKSVLNAEEITALREVNWNKKLSHYFLVGNHESDVNGLYFSTTNCFSEDLFSIIDTPTCLSVDNCNITYIPYCLESDRKPLADYIKSEDNLSKKETKIVLSHNDIKGIRYGVFESKEGFDIEDIEKSCDLFLNGHLHNGAQFCKNGINLGNLTGQNFTEDAFNYSHGAFVLDTKTLDLDFIENPYALNFYQIAINTKEDFQIINSLKNQAVLSIRCIKSLYSELRDFLKTKTSIIESRIMIINEKNQVNTVDTSELLKNDDYLSQFKKFSLEKLGSSSEVLHELNTIIMNN